MRLNLVISSLAAGGAERVITTLANHWVESGHDVRLVTTHDGGQAPHYPLDDRVVRDSVDPRNTGLPRQWGIFNGLRSQFRDNRPDAIVSFLNYTNILTLAASRGASVPVVISERLDPRVIGIGPVWSLARRLTYRRAACLVAQTPAAADLFDPLVPGRVRVIPNPVPAPPVGTLPPLGCDGWERPTILAVGRLQHQKGFDLAIRAMAALPEEFRNWRMVILGEGPLRSELECLRGELDMEDRVEMPGRVEDPWPWLDRAKIFVMSSRTEGFPNALCEAMSAGLAVISADCPSGPSDIITPEVDGLLVAPEDSDALAGAMARLMGEEKLRNRLALAAPKIRDRYSSDTVLRQWDDLIEQFSPEG